MLALHRRVGLLVLLALTLLPLLSLAQDEAITGVGSGIVAPTFQAIADASGTAVNLTVTGTATGFSDFCQNSADLTIATREMSVTEESNCLSNGVNFLEFLLGYNAIAFISSPDATYSQCLSPADLNTIFAPSAAGQVINWQQVIPTDPNLPLTLVLPTADSPLSAILDQQVEGDGIRADVQTPGDDAAIISAVSQTPGALGVVSAASLQNAGDTIRVLQLNSSAAGCVTPSQDTLADARYTAADTFFVYVNTASLTKPGMTELVSAVSAPATADLVSAQGLIAPTADQYADNQTIAAETQTGRRFGRSDADFVIPDGISGQVGIGGAADGQNYMQAVTSAFNARYSTVTTNLTIEGQPAGIRRLCNGEIDIALTISDLTAEQADNCAANNITPMPVEVGRQAVVLVANPAAAYAQCLTTAQLGTLWSAASASTITNWNQVSADFPDVPLTLFAPEPGDPSIDVLLGTTAGGSTPMRVDIQLENSPSIRAAATNNVEGALTFMSWTTYQGLLDEGTSLAPVSVDAGGGCVAPSLETIGDGSYPLTRPLRVVFNRLALARLEVQSLAWFMFSDDNYSLITNSGIVGLEFGDLPDIRAMLRETFTQAQVEAAAAAVATPEATGEPTAEATVQATAEPTQEATAEASAEPTQEVTPEATSEPTAEATPAS